MFSKVAVCLFAYCAVALARPQDASANQQTPNQLLDSNQPRHPNQIRELDSNRFQGFNPNLFQDLNPNQLQNRFARLNDGQGSANPKYQSPILEIPNHVIDWSQHFVDNSVNRLGAALGQSYDDTERVVNNVADTVNEVGKRGLQDGVTLLKTGFGLLSTIPKIGLSLLSRNNNNNNSNNNGFRY
ncbi:uncharacterized protein LOC131669932 [Phymastichus coffea]|uniref:uncharacterized protein LOC131669932 n=1 Tax=Phymastichus coffea TaxID=108790 RepID=UPI00273AF3CA|nr:uncharacterized protein LOC131669932 [Phymastichus coffea]XP_058801140.1 uncharacterized protein LOC131669932 [Phymastichus coffea]